METRNAFLGNSRKNSRGNQISSTHTTTISTKNIIIVKFSLIPSIISISLSSLVAYGFYAFSNNNPDTYFDEISMFFAFVFSLITLLSSFGITFKTSRITTLIKTLSLVSFFVSLIANILITSISTSIPFLVISMGLLLLVYLLISYGLNRSDQ